MANTLSGLESFDPSGSTPQPAPLSGLQLPSLFGGMGGEGDMSGAAGPGAAGGAAGGPGLDFFQLLGSLQGQGDSGITATPPNLSSLLGQIGQGGIGSGNLGQLEGNGSFGGFGQAGGLSNPQAQSGATGIAGSSGGELSSIDLIRQALGIGKSAIGHSGIAGNTSGTGGTGGLDIANFPGTTVSGSETGDTSSLFQSGDLTSSFLNDPTIAGLIQSGGLTGGEQIPSELWDTFKNDPAFLQALTSGHALDSTNLLSDYPLGGTGGLDNPLAGIDAGASSGFGNLFGGIGGSLGLGAAGLGLAQSAAAKNPIGILQNLYGLYSGVNSLGGFGGPTFGSLVNSLFSGGEAAAGAAGAGAAGAGEAAGAGAGALAGGAGAGLSGFGAIVSAPFILASISDMFDKSAQGFSNNVRNTFGAVPGNVSNFQGVSGLLGGINEQSSPEDISNMFNQLQGIQGQFQGTGNENLLKSAGTLTGENTRFGLLGGGKNYSATYPNIQNVMNAINPGLTGLSLGRLKLSDLYGQQTGKNLGYNAEEYARQFAPQSFLDALAPDQGSGYDTNWETTPLTQEQSLNRQNILNQLGAIQPGHIEQSLADMFAPYGGWGISHALMGPGVTNWNNYLAPYRP